MFADTAERDRERAGHFKQKKAAREYVWYCADQVFLAVYHQRPEPEIEMLLARLALATGQGEPA